MGCSSSSGGAAPSVDAEKEPQQSARRRLSQDDLEDLINPKSIDEVYDVGFEIARSGRTFVHRARRRAPPDAFVAVKTMPREKLQETTGNARRGLAREVRLMQRVDHLNVLKLFDIFDCVNEVPPSCSPSALCRWCR